MGFSTPHSERDAVIQLGMVAGPYLSHPDGVNEKTILQREFQFTFKQSENMDKVMIEVILATLM